MKFNKKDINDFKSVIESIVDVKIDNRRITSYVAAIVDNVDNNGFVSVVIPPEMNKVVTQLLNKTGEILTKGDSVELATKNGLLSNAWVAVKHGTNNSGGGGSGTSDYNGLINKPRLSTTTTTSLTPNSNELLSGVVSLHKVAKTGSYSDLVGKPNIPDEQVNADWNATSGKAHILNKPTNLETTTNKVSVSSIATDEQYPTAKSVYDYGQEIVALIPAGGLKIPISLDLESHLPTSGQSDGDYYFIQDMDITAPGKTGRAWWNSTESTTEFLKVFDQYNSMDGVSIVQTGGGSWQVSTEWLQGVLNLSTVATSGSYTDLINLPTFKTVNQQTVVGTGDIQISGVEDGDKGDITVSEDGQEWTIKDEAVTNNKIKSLDGSKINSNTVSNQKLSNVPALTVKGNPSSTLPSTPQDLTMTQLRNMVQDANNKFVTDNQKTTWTGKQDKLVSGTNIKTLNSKTLLGSGNIDIDDGASIISAEFNNDDIVFTKDDSTSVTLPDAKNTLQGPVGPKGDKGDTGDQGLQGPKGDKGDTGIVQGLVAGDNVTIDSSNPAYPIISSTGGGTDTSTIYVTSTTARTTAAKVGTTDEGSYVPQKGDKLIVTFTGGISVSNPTLNIDGSGAKSIKLGMTNVSATYLSTSTITPVAMWYDGDSYQLYGSYVNTTYSEITEAEITTGTATTARAITGRRFKFALDIISTLIDNKIKADNEKKYYIGKVIIDTANINPNTYLGFGTWQYWGSGRVPVGVDTSQSEFNSVEKTGGAKTHTLTTAQIPSHTHTQNAHNHGASSGNAGGHSHTGTTSSAGAHIHPVKQRAVYRGGDTYNATSALGGAQSSDVVLSAGAHTHTFSTSTQGDHSHTVTVNNATATNQNTGSGNAHNNLQPYITCYMWKRIR